MIAFEIVGSDADEMYVGLIPGRKKPVLSKYRPGVIDRPWAYFRDDEAAEEFIAWMRELIKKVGERN